VEAAAVISEIDYPNYKPDYSIARKALGAAVPAIAAQAWDAGFTAACAQHGLQRSDPSHPITRTNPYVTT